MNNVIDLKILNIIINNKNDLREFVSFYNEKVFCKEYRRFARHLFRYFNSYNSCPSLDALIETAGQNANLEEYIVDVWKEIEEQEDVDERDFKLLLNKIKNRYNRELLFEFSSTIEEEKDMIEDGGETLDVSKLNDNLSKTYNEIRALGEQKAYKVVNLKESAEDWAANFKARQSATGSNKGIFTGFSILDHYTYGIRPAELWLIAGDTGGGKCHAKGQGILKYDGTIVKVEDIKVGDLLASPTKEPRKVLKVNNGFGQMYDIIPIKGKTWRVNDEHILTVYNSRNKKTEDVSVKDYLKWSKTRQGHSKLIRASGNFEKNNNQIIDPYFLGLILGDGSVSGSISITTADEEIVNYIDHQCKKYNLKLSIEGNQGKAKLYRLAGVQGIKNSIVKLFEDYDLKNVKCENKFVPQEYKSGSFKTRSEVLAGLLDTDGHHNGRGGFDYISKSQQLANDVVFLSRSIGLAAYMHESIKTCTNNGTTGKYFRVCISGNTDKIPCKIPRKKAPKRKQIKDVLHVGFDVVKKGKEKYYGFTLDGDGRYLLDDFTITHNSLFLINVAKNIWLGENEMVDSITNLKSIINNNAWKPGNDVLFVTLEMPEIEIQDRILSSMCEIDSLNLMKGIITKDEGKKLATALKFRQAYPNDLEIADVPRGCSMAQIQQIYDETCLKLGKKINVVVIDYLGLMADSGEDSDADWEKLKNIAEQMHEFARINDVAVFSAVQVKTSKPGEGGIGLHRIGRCSMIMHNANLGLQIENRENEENRPDAIIHCIKFRRGPKFIMNNLRKAFMFTKFIDSGFGDKNQQPAVDESDDLSEVMDNIFTSEEEETQND